MEIIKNTTENLIKTEKLQNIELAMTLPVSIQRYAVARFDAKIIDTDIAESLANIYDIVVQAMINNGNKKDTEDRDLVLNISDQCYTLIHSKYQLLTFAELKLALFNLIDGQYCERDARFSINLSSISIAIKGFLQDRFRSMAWKEMDELLKPKPELTEEQKEGIVKANLISLFNEQKEKYQKNGNRFDMDLPQITFVYYDYLKDRNLINFSPEKREYIYNRAQNKFEAEMNKKVFERTYKREFVNEIISNLNSNGPFKNLCRLEAIREYFVDLYDKKISIENLLSENQQDAKNI